MRSRFTQDITDKQKKEPHHPTDISVIILSAGIGSRIKSYEPRSLIKIGNKCLLEHQINCINNCFSSVEIIGVFGYLINKVIKKIGNKIRIVENQLYATTNTSESLRLGFNNTDKNNLLFIHGDLYFNIETIKKLDYSRSFIVVDTKNKIQDKEVGVTIQSEKATMLSYGLPIKWAQMAYITGKEYKILKNIFYKFEENEKKLLSFELINKIISAGGSFYCYEPKKMNILEIDCIKDINYENFNC